LRQRHGFEHGFPLIRSPRASAQRSTSVLLSFVLSLLIVAASFAIRQSKTNLADHAYGGVSANFGVMSANGLRNAERKS
jgi:hypothetical protein